MRLRYGRSKKTIAMLCFSLLYAFVQPAEAVALNEMAEDAIDNGHAKGEISGPMTAKIQRATRSTAPIHAQIDVVKRFNQEGCARLEFVLTQDNVPTQDGKTIQFKSAFQMNLCRDGRAPLEAVDMANIPEQ
ncbi:hypothetical protein RY831_15115 [Noviherbaspirillum sp. CPCC 100848]|uniref:Uncharacterized protein n=1 Tax=Noviherbaspirillum album TaxID=3080276 RepID=A0ABU6JA43_9BURK|nr:hypothetical protein [Noviherbaspirillum sp. CPCC 100848]MEC4720491.1 hypothetical protein [Noviherbaspirillum sp. CPCC 100848]